MRVKQGLVGLRGLFIWIFRDCRRILPNDSYVRCLVLETRPGFFLSSPANDTASSRGHAATLRDVTSASVWSSPGILTFDEVQPKLEPLRTSLAPHATRIRGKCDSRDELLWNRHLDDVAVLPQFRV